MVVIPLRFPIAHGSALSLKQIFLHGVRRELQRRCDLAPADESASTPLNSKRRCPAEQLDLQRKLERRAGEAVPTHQACFLLRKRDGLSLPRSQRRLQLSAHTVKKYLFQAKGADRAQWETQRE